MRSAHDAIRELLAAIEERDIRAVEQLLSPVATWQNVPHPPAVGRDAVVALLRPIITWSDRVEWEIVSEAHAHELGWLERIDRFWIDGEEHAVRCNGVFQVTDGLVSCVRDYVDLGEWRTRIGPVLDRRRAADPLDVTQRHLRAVERLDPVGMVADYAADAVLRRGPAGEPDAVHRGWRAIAAYFDTVPARLAGHQPVWESIERRGRDGIATIVEVSWTINTDRGGIRGTDRYRVADGRIVDQQVVLHDRDF